MSDTPDDIVRRYHGMLMALDPVERLRRGCAMFETVKTLALARIRGTVGEAADESEVLRRLWLQFYGQDFLPEHRMKILARLEDAWTKRTSSRQG